MLHSSSVSTKGLLHLAWLRRKNVVLWRNRATPTKTSSGGVDSTRMVDAKIRVILYPYNNYTTGEGAHSAVTLLRRKERQYVVLASTSWVRRPPLPA